MMSDLEQLLKAAVGNIVHPEMDYNDKSNQSQFIAYMDSESALGIINIMSRKILV
jgi:hypothetical protein